MTIRIIICVLLGLLYIVLEIWPYRNKLPSKARKTILIILATLAIPFAVSLATGFNASQTIDGLNKKIDKLEGQLIAQDATLEDISKNIMVALEDECLKDLKERKKIIKNLHDQSFKISKNDYDNLVDSIFVEIEQRKNQEEKLSTEQKKLSDESLIYFDILTRYVLDKVDNLIAQLNSRGEVLDIQKTEIPEKFFYADDGENINVRIVELESRRRIICKIGNRKLDKGKIVSLPSINIIGNDGSPRISINGPPIKTLPPVGPQPMRMTLWRGQELKITYPLGEDPLMLESFRKSIDEKMSRFIRLLYLSKT